MKPLPTGSFYRYARVQGVPVRAFALGLLALGASAQEPPVAGFFTNPSNPNGEERLIVQFFDDSTGDVTAWHWSFGDGRTSAEQNPQHQYFFGTFDVSLTVSGPGGSDTLTKHELVEVAAPPPLALGTMPVPLPAQLFEVVADMDRAVELGKALFWDVQLGSDGLTACASCHYHAGVDNRPRNTLHPGANGSFDTTLSGRAGGPNTRLNAGDFPFTKWFDPNDGLMPLARTDDVRGAAGVQSTLFDGLSGGGADLGVDVDDELFQVSGADTLQTTGRDAPTVIGAIYFHRLFWDGRANHFFNGTNIWGNAQGAAGTVLEKLPDGSLGETALMLNNAAAASQAIGPPLSGTEMSWAGRSWPEVGRKLLGARPLDGQRVDPTDGVLGALADPAGPGLAPGTTYADLVRAAFHERWWGSEQLTADGFSQMEANFSLFFGMAILCYEATLIPDRAPFDRFRAGDFDALSESQLRGMSLFLGRGRCIACHETPAFAGSLRDVVVNFNPEEAEGIIERMFMNNWFAETSITFATNPGAGELPLNFNPYRRPVRIITPDDQVVASTVLPAGQQCPEAGVDVFPLEPGFIVPELAEFVGEVTIEKDGACGFRVTVRFEWNAFGLPGATYALEIGGQTFPWQVPQTSPQAVYDNGFYNIGVAPETEDLGVGGEGPFGPLAITRRVQDGENIGQDTRPGGAVLPDERIAVNGAFKTPTLRNIELTGPYMHNGSMATLEQVVEFYARGTDFGDVNFRNRAPDVFGFDISEEEKADLVAFLEALTDPRVRHERAPFDHPELPLKVGHVGDHEAVVADTLGNAELEIEVVPATGAAGGPAIPAFIDRLAPSITVAVAFVEEESVRVGFICDKRPERALRIRLRSSDPAVAVPSTDQVLFSPADWRVTRFVDVARVDGLSTPVDVTLRTSHVQSTDPEFSGLAVQDVQIHFSGAPSATPGAHDPDAPTGVTGDTSRARGGVQLK